MITTGNTFKSIISGCDCYGLNKAFLTDADIDIAKITCYIDWSVDVDMREYGIKSIDVLIQKVVASVEWEIDVTDATKEDVEQLVLLTGGEYSNDVVSGLIEVNSTDKWHDGEWKIETELSCDPSNGNLTLADCEIDFDTMTITINN